MSARPRLRPVRVAVAAGALAVGVPGSAVPAQASSSGPDAAACYTEAVFRLAEPLDGQPSDTRFHSVGAGTARCAGVLDGRPLDPGYGGFTASGSASSTSCQTGAGQFLGHLQLRDVTGAPLQVPVRVSFTRVGLTGTATGEVVSSGTRLVGAFAAQPVDGDCANTGVEHVRIRVAVEIGA